MKSGAFVVKEKKVLIVDDNETVLMALEYNLQQAGYSVLKASDGEAAFRLASSDFPDIIVSDITMPEMDGIELCKKIRAMPRLSEVPFIFLTAHGEREERVKGLRSGADDYMVKPFDIEELIVKIDILYKNMQKRSFSNTLSGNLKELPVADTLQIFSQAKKEGCLTVKTAKHSGFITFRDGNVMDVVFMGLGGEDAMAELLLLKEGNFHYEPREVAAGSIDKPLGYLMLEVTRLVDEKLEQMEFIPDFSRRLTLVGKSAENSPEVKILENALQGGAATGDEVVKASGLSRIRVGIGLARLIQEGGVKPEEKETERAQPEAQTPSGKSVRILLAFTDELSASLFLKMSEDAYNVSSDQVITGGLADFLKISVNDDVLQIFSLRGEKKFSFLWEPMLRTTDVVIFLLNSTADKEHIDFFKEKLLKFKDVPLVPVTLSEALSSGGTDHIKGTGQIAALYSKLLSSVKKK